MTRKPLEDWSSRGKRSHDDIQFTTESEKKIQLFWQIPPLRKSAGRKTLLGNPSPDILVKYCLEENEMQSKNIYFYMNLTTINELENTLKWTALRRHILIKQKRWAKLVKHWVILCIKTRSVTSGQCMWATYPAIWTSIL